ncbi:MAG TPA: chromate efflux transporter [Rhodocyclaceae bacterium]|nr:chromate efflux transporter [Rhodocyclaceae bacterium]
METSYGNEIATDPETDELSLSSLFWIFMRIACVSFGGYMSMIAAVQNVIVERRKLLLHNDVVDGISLASVLPGPVAINVVGYIGYRLRGILGALVCIGAAIAPGFVLMVLFTVAYLQWGHIPAVSKIFMGVVPAVTAIILAAAWNMWHKSITGLREGLLAIAAASALLFVGGLAVTLAIVFIAAIAGRYWFGSRPGRVIPKLPPRMTSALAYQVENQLKHPSVVRETTLMLVDNHALNAYCRKISLSRLEENFLLLGCAVGIAALLRGFGPTLLFKLFGVFGAMSVLLFGGAYVFIPLLQHSVVNGYGWVTQREFVDAVSMAQMMPGPVIVCAAFIGYKVAGLAGAIAATMGIVLPSAIVMLLCTRMLDQLKNSPNTMAALRGVRAAVVGMVFTAAVLVGKTAAPSWMSVVLGLAAFIALTRYRIEAVWLVPVAGLAGFLFY